MRDYWYFLDRWHICLCGQKNVIDVSIQLSAADLTDKAFIPSTVNVKVGDTVVWTTDNPVIHTIVEKEVMGFFSNLIFWLSYLIF